MKFGKKTAGIFIPDNTALNKALKRTTHLGIGAHQDDLEIMAFHGIMECYGKRNRWFTGVTCTNGAGSARSGVYADYTDLDMQKVRRTEQNNAAAVGGYSAMIQLDYSSKETKDTTNPALCNDLIAILKATKPGVVYTHNPADKHETHIAVLAAVIKAIRSLPCSGRPERLLGCEVWRDLDWMDDKEKVALDVSAHESLATALTGLFDSQVDGGKRYDLATIGRRRANATYFESHGVDKTHQLLFAMDLTPLIRNDTLSVVDYVTGFIRRFEENVRTKLMERFACR